MRRAVPSTLITCSLLISWTCGAAEIDISAAPQPTADTTFLLDFEQPDLAPVVAAGEGGPPAGQVEVAEGHRGVGADFTGSRALEYPARGNIDLNQGTLELWINTHWGSRGRTRSHYLVSHPLDWGIPGHMRLWYWAPSETWGVLRFDYHAVSSAGDGYIFAAWPGDGWHHIAARWHSRDGIALYIDGVKVAEKRGTWEPLPPAGGLLTFSNADNPADAVIDDVRIRSTPSYAPDEPALVLDVGDAAMLQADAGAVPVRVMNRREEPATGALTVAVRDYFGERVAETVQRLELPGFSERVLDVEFPVTRPSRYFVAQVSLRDGAGEAIVEREDIVTVSALSGPRKAICLDGEWEQADGVWGEFTPPADGWSPVVLPRKEPSFPTHLRWYRRSFEVPAEMGERVRLVPRHVKQRARWWVNGIEVGDSEYAYVPYSFDITDAIRPGERNEILVAVMDWVECARPDLQAHLATTHPGDRGGVEGWPFIKPCGGEVLPAGIIESVWVYGHGGVWASDVAVVTSTRNRTMTVRGVVHNDSGRQRQCTVGNVVFDGAEQALALPEWAGNLPGGQSRRFEVTAQWDQPRLWWPDDPHLYRLQTDVQVGDALEDSVSTRFGFREFRPEGDVFMLNEVPMHLFAAASWPNTVPMGWPGRVSDRWDATRVLFESLREAGHDIFRAHTEPWSDLLADLCDETGMMLVTEGVMSSIPGKYNWSHPDLMPNMEAFYRLWPRREMNHPALVIRSIENEVGYLLQERIMGDQETIARVRDGFVECGRIVHEADPSRPIMYEGSGPVFYDVADIYNNHYPGDEYRWAWYPNASWWPGRQMDIYFTRDWMWDRRKPLYMGEWGWFPGGQDQFAAYMGPAVYRPGVTLGLAKSVLWEMGIAGMRYYGVSANCPWNALEGTRFERFTTDRPRHRVVREGFAKLKVAIRERGSVYFVGDDVTRTVSAYNDTLQVQDFSVRWRLLVDGAVTDAGEWSATVPPAGTTRRVIVADVPRDLDGVHEGSFEATLHVAGEQVSSADSPFRVFPHITRRHDLSVLAAGLRATTMRGLQRLGVAVRELGELSALQDGAMSLIIGPHAGLTAEDAPALRSFVERGGQLVVLQQMSRPAWLPLDAELAADEPMTRCFASWRDSPLLDGLEERDLSFWPDDHVVAEGGWRRPEQVRYRAVMEGGVGLGLSPLAEARVGAGRVWLVHLPLWASTPVNPVTERVGHNLLDELGRFEPRPPGTVALLDEPHGDVEALLADVGAHPTSLTGRLSDADLSGHACVVVEAAPESMAEAVANTERLRGFVAAGGTVWLHGVRPESADAVAELCGRSVRLEGLFELPLTLLPHPLTAGMTEAQLHWSVDPANFRPVRADMVDWMVDVAGGRAVTEPAALVEAPHGSGRFLIDQLHWETEFRNRTRAREFVAGLCANLGVELSPVEPPEPAVTFVAHFDGSAVADYAAGRATPEPIEDIAFVEGKFGRAVDFTGTEDLRYQQRLNLDINSGTIELWFNGSAADDQILFRTTPGQFNDADFVALWTWQGLLRLDHHSLPGGLGSGYMVHKLELSPGWHHIAATWDHSSGAALYVDGQMVARKEGGWEPTEARFRHFTLSAPHRPVTGAIDELRILTYALTPEQIAADAAATEPFPAPHDGGP